ncbi:MAG: alanine:cation symporter family protein [Candidatus Puniceispirillaceae bacterium]
MQKSILLAVDGSPGGERALDYVLETTDNASVQIILAYVIEWSYYGLKSWTYLFGEEQRTQTIYKVIFCVFVALGCMVQLGPLLDISDAFVFLICVPNILGLYFLAPIVKREMENYRARLASGEIKRFKN